MIKPPADFEVYRSLSPRRNQRWRWRLWSAGRKIANSGEGYSDEIYAREIGLSVVTGQYEVRERAGLD